MHNLLMLDKDDTLVELQHGDHGFVTLPVEGAVAFVREQSQVRNCVVVTMANERGVKHLKDFHPNIKAYYGAEVFQSVEGVTHFHKNTHLSRNAQAKRNIEIAALDMRGFAKDLEFVKKTYAALDQNHKNINAVMIGNEPDIQCMPTDPTTPLIVVEPYSLWPTRNNTRILLDTLYAGTETALTFDELYAKGKPTPIGHNLITDSVITTIEDVAFRLSRNLNLGIRMVEERFTEGVRMRFG